WIESEYNDGQGIKYVTYFQPILAPLKVGEKRRKGKRADLINCTTYVHENSSFAEVLDAAITSVGRNSQTMKFKIVGGDLRTATFSAVYSIPRTNLKKMQLASDTHFAGMVKDACKKSSPEIKLEITEMQPDNATPSDDETEPESSKKTKKRQMSTEEEEMAETIIQLKHAHHCSDRTCTSRICFVGNPTATHVRLTPLHLSTWAAAIV
ncbi:hypothetical protein DFH09DRAFT_865134, partial [Mycena vulgaris]